MLNACLGIFYALGFIFSLGFWLEIYEGHAFFIPTVFALCWPVMAIPVAFAAGCHAGRKRLESVGPPPRPVPPRVMRPR